MEYTAGMQSFIEHYWGYLAYLFAVIILAIVGHFYQSKYTKIYRDRKCMGRYWFKAFPTASKEEIRQFLVLFVEAFGFSQKLRCQFEPGDSLIELYKAAQAGIRVDNFEFENLLGGIEDTYGFDAQPLCGLIDDGMTLGELFSFIRCHAVRG